MHQQPSALWAEAEPKVMLYGSYFSSRAIFDFFTGPFSRELMLRRGHFGSYFSPVGIIQFALLSGAREGGFPIPTIKLMTPLMRPF